jgi:hypothetical protein
MLFSFGAVLRRIFCLGVGFALPDFSSGCAKSGRYKKCDGKPPEGFGKAEGQHNTGGSEFFTSWLGFVALWAFMRLVYFTPLAVRYR